MSGALCYLTLFLASYTFPWLSDSSFLDLHGTFALYAIISAITVVFVVFFVPETRGKSLQEIELMFKVKKKDQVGADDGSVNTTTIV